MRLSRSWTFCLRLRSERSNRRAELGEVRPPRLPSHGVRRNRVVFRRTIFASPGHRRMNAAVDSSPEAVPLQRLSDRAYEGLAQSFNALVFMLFTLPAAKANEPKIRTHFNAAHPNLPKSRGQYDLRSQRTEEFARWASQENNSPMLQLALINACTSYENAVKQIAVAIELGYKPKESKSHGRTVFLGSEELMNAHKRIRKSWDDRLSLQGFLHQRIYGVPNVLPSDINLPSLDENSPEIDHVEAAFLVRNDCVHNMGRASKQIDLCGTTQVMGLPLDITPKALNTICKAMLVTVNPFDPGDRAWNSWLNYPPFGLSK